MFLQKKYRRRCLLSLQQLMRIMNTEPIAWGIIFLVSVLCLLPFLVLDQPGMNLNQSAQFFSGCILSLVVGAGLRARIGGIISWLVVMSGLFLISLRACGPTQMMQTDGQALFSTGIGFLITALAIGQLRSVSQRLKLAHERLAKAHATIQEQALTDGLTGLPNHGAIIERIEAELQHCQSSQRNCAIIFVDVDHFKRINDTWGHAAGDAALCAVGQRLREGIRKEDCIGRYGGEEFAILLSDIDQSEAFDLAERLRCSIAEEPYLWQRAEMQLVIPLPLTASFGLATYPLDGLSARELLTMADTAMYTAKHTGRNRVCLPDEVDTTPLKQDEKQQLPEYSEQSILQTISTMATFHDQETPAHANRMIRRAEATMRVLGRSEDEVALLRLAVQLHDIGKIGIPDAILHKPGPLTQDEWGVMRRHPQIGQQILTQARGQLGLVSHIVVAHHERWDGQGYPYGLAQQEIPLGARLLSVVDTYDAMTSARPYREALSAAEAREELQRCAGSQFDPQVVDAFLQTLQAQESQGSIVPVSASL